MPQVAARPTSLLLGLQGTLHPFVGHVTYRELARLPLAERVDRMRDPETKRRMLAERASYDSPVLAFIASAFHKVFPLGDPPDYEPDPSTSVKAIAEREGRPALEVIYDVMLRRGGKELLYLPILGWANGGLDAIDEMLRHPATVLGLGDGGAHCGVLCDASLPTFMLTHWARDRRSGTLPLETVVHLQTRRTAELYGFDDRGVLAPGFVGDVNLIDHEQLTLAPPEMAYDLPAGGRRLIQRATGYAATVKSGVVVREKDEPTGEYPGRLLRGPQPAPVA